jgi:hypothetical protein
MNNQFKFKPDKNKYLSNVDTLDSTHKKITDEFNKKRNELDKKTLKLNKFKNELEELDKKRNDYIEIQNFIKLRATLIDNISNLEEEIKEISNYDDETEYYSKTYQILFNYYDILDGQIESEINNKLININNHTDNNYTDNIDNTYNMANIANMDNTDNSDNKKYNNDDNIDDNNQVNNVSFVDVDEWEFDGIKIFNTEKKSTLDILNELKKKTKKEKKNTRKRVKNVETLIKDNNYDIFEFINSGNKNNQISQDNFNDKINEYSIYDRSKLYDDYKTTLEGYTSKKKYSKICENCKIDKVLNYSEGSYVCMKCGEVENCIIESEIINYKEPMVEKPTFPYKRKNHFCEWKPNKVLIITLKITKNN